MVISDFKVLIVFVALGLPFPQVHLSVGGGGGQQVSSLSSCGISTGPASYYYCMCIVGSKVIVFAASAIFEIIALKTAGK